MPKNFNMPKKGQMGGMMQQMQRLQEQLMQTQEQLAQEILTHSAGGGALKDGDVEMLQDLILTAVNGALDASRAMAAERLGPLSGGLPF
jgi:DNA-binding protein YbaB